METMPVSFIVPCSIVVLVNDRDLKKNYLTVCAKNCSDKFNYNVTLSIPHGVAETQWPNVGP